LWGLAGTAVALLVLLGAAVYFWAVISKSSVATSPGQEVATVTAKTNIIYDRLLFHSITEVMTADFVIELWQKEDGRQLQSKITDSNGNFVSIRDEWQEFVQLMLQPDSRCHDLSCVIERTRQPLPPGTAELQAEQGCEGWGASQIGQETWGDGRILDIIEISYGCYTTTTASIAEADQIVAPPESEYLLPQRRLIKIDPETLEILAIEDYEGEQLLYSIVRLERQLLTTAVPATSTFIAHEDDLSVQFGNELQLTGYELREDNRLETTTITWWNGNEETQETNRVYLSLTLYWQAQKQLQHDDYILVIHLLDEEGNIAQAYNIHTAGRPRPMTTWQEGQIIQDVHHLPLGEEVMPGNYEVVLSLYNSQTDVRLSVTAAAEQMVVDEGTAVWLTDWLFAPRDDNDPFQPQPTP